MISDAWKRAYAAVQKQELTFSGIRDRINKNNIDEAIDLIKQNTRRYSKRQFTWFNNQMKDIKWFDVNYNDFNETIKEIDIYLQEKR